MKRTDYISWDEYFMGIAMLAARRSKDPNTQVGACIVSPDNIIISTGYNGMPKGCSDDEYSWAREGSETKYPYVVHAELNAILNANGRDLRGSRLYVALFPCNECAKAIIQSGVKEVIYLSDAGLQADDEFRRCPLYPAAAQNQIHHPQLRPRGGAEQGSVTPSPPPPAAAPPEGEPRGGLLMKNGAYHH